MELIERIFNGTMEELKESGIKFTMDSLAARLVISKRTLYEQIPSKEALIDMVIERSFQDVRKQQEQILEDVSLTALEKAKKLMCMIPNCSDMLDYYHTGEIEKVYPVLYQKMQTYIENGWDIILKLLNDAMEQGMLRRKNLYLMKELFCAMLEKLSEGRLAQQGIGYEEAVEEMMDIVLKGLMAE